MADGEATVEERGGEARRLEAVRGLALLDTPPAPEFEALVDLACRTLDIAICGISLIDDSRQWFKALRGLGRREMPRELAFCTRLITARAPVGIPDLSADSGTWRHPLVTGAPHLRFYAGVPLMLGAEVVGALCVFDTRPRSFTQSQAEALERLAAVGNGLLRQYDSAQALSRLSRELEAQGRLADLQRRQLSHQHRVLAQASTLARIGAWERDLETGTSRWSEGMYRLYEVPRDFVIDEAAILSFYPPGERRRVKGIVSRAAKAGTGHQFDAQIVTAKGNRRWVRVTCEIDHVDGVPVRRHGIMRDITEEKEAADRIASLAERDGLTGLYNRAFLQDHIDALPVRRPGRRHAFLLLDLDGFKDINDTHGHAAGDECLKRVSRRIARAAGREAVVARIGGDEFAVLLEEPAGRQDAKALARHVRKAIQVPLRWRGHAFQLSASIGIAYWSGGEPVTSDALFADADLALYDAKGAGKNCEAVYRPELRAEATRRFAIVRDVGRALKRGGLELYYQPKVRLAGGAHQGFEALLRWVREDGSVVSAGAFEPALKDPGLSAEIGHFVIERALCQAAEWQGQGLDFGSVAINLGASQFRNRNLGRLMLERIDALHLPPGAIEVEVTEDVFLSRAAGHAQEVCRELKYGGVTIAFDDFGTGFASLTHLREFPVDVLKIDRSFISRLGTDASTTSIVHAVVDLAHNLDLGVVAEGVETEGQAQFLRAVGCEWAQGYLYARPMDARSVPDYLGPGRELLRA